jgi:hypothetical protein
VNHAAFRSTEISSGPCTRDGSPSAWKIVWMCGIVMSSTTNGCVQPVSIQIQRYSSQSPHRAASTRTTVATRAAADRDATPQRRRSPVGLTAATCAIASI